MEPPPQARLKIGNALQTTMGDQSSGSLPTNYHRHALPVTKPSRGQNSQPSPIPPIQYDPSSSSLGPNDFRPPSADPRLRPENPTGLKYRDILNEYDTINSQHMLEFADDDGMTARARDLIDGESAIQARENEYLQNEGELISQYDELLATSDKVQASYYHHTSPSLHQDIIAELEKKYEAKVTETIRMARVAQRSLTQSEATVQSLMVKLENSQRDVSEREAKLKVLNNTVLALETKSTSLSCELVTLKSNVSFSGDLYVLRRGFHNLVSEEHILRCSALPKRKC